METTTTTEPRETVVRCLYEEHARQKLGLPPEWRVYKWQCNRGPNREVKSIRIEGAVAFWNPRRKAYVWDMTDTKHKLTLSAEEHEAFVKQWEQSTGHCSNCLGAGQTLASWSVTDGTKWRPCSKCKGTGKSPEPPGVWPDGKQI